MIVLFLFLFILSACIIQLNFYLMLFVVLPYFWKFIMLYDDINVNLKNLS